MSLRTLSIRQPHPSFAGQLCLSNERKGSWPKYGSLLCKYLGNSQMFSALSALGQGSTGTPWGICVLMSIKESLLLRELEQRHVPEDPALNFTQPRVII